MKFDIDLSCISFDCEFDIVLLKPWELLTEQIKNIANIGEADVLLTIGPVLLNDRKFHRFGQFIHRSAEMSPEMEIIETMGDINNQDLLLKQLRLNGRKLLVLSQPAPNICRVEYLCI